MNYSTYIKKLKQLLDKQSQKLCAAKDKEKFLFVLKKLSIRLYKKHLIQQIKYGE
ncbi:hypothetical protein CNEO_1230014 [Clostridium neonatale]|nr:hypothetical protein CNEO_1230014 [Clostridium neonatale]